MIIIEKLLLKVENPYFLQTFQRHLLPKISSLKMLTLLSRLGNSRFIQAKHFISLKKKNLQKSPLPTRVNCALLLTV